MATIDPAHLAGTVIIGRYVIEGEPLHTGGFAHIYRAIDRRVADRPVAVKVLRRKYAHDARWRSQFLTETNALNAVKSQNVVVVHDRIEDDPDTGLDFLIMEWINGGNLESFRLSRSTFDLDHLLTLAIGITEGVQGIHQRVAHGDITPRNIMLKDDKIPVIIDFGLSWDILEQEEAERQQGGTILYLAPEQFGYVPEQGTAADIYSLGAVLYFLFTGQHYFSQLKAAVEDFERLYGTSVTLHDYGRHLGDLWSRWRYQPLQLTMPPQMRARLNGLLQSMLTRKSSERPAAAVVLEELKHIQQAVSKPNPQTATPLEAGDYSVVIADYADGLLSDNRHPLKAFQYKGRWVFETDDLYLGAQDTGCQGVLMHHDEIVFSAWFEVEEQPFRFYMYSPKVGETASLNIKSGVLKSPSSITLADCEFEQQITLYKPLDMTLLVDGMLSAPDLQAIQALAADVFKGLAKSDYDLRIAVCVYGEYLQHPGARQGWKMPFAILPRDFDTLDHAQQYIAALQPQDFKGKGYSGSMELGLFTMNLLKWRPAATKHVLVIGSSPPHPSSPERAHFQLVDYTVEEYRYSDSMGNEYPAPHWLSAWHDLRGKGVHTRAIWIRPSDYDVMPQVQDYIDYVWNTLNDETGRALRPVQPAGDVRRILQWIAHTIRSVPMFNDSIRFPLLAAAAQELRGMES